MAIEFNCQHCGKSIKTKDEMAGRMGRCPHCRGTMQIPDSGEQVLDGDQLWAIEEQQTSSPASTSSTKEAASGTAYQGSVYRPKVVNTVSHKTQNRLVVAYAASTIAFILAMCGFFSCGCLMPILQFGGQVAVGSLFMYTGLALEVLACPIGVGAVWLSWDVYRGLAPGEPARRKLMVAMVVSGVGSVLSAVAAILLVGMAALSFDDVTGINF